MAVKKTMSIFLTAVLCLCLLSGCQKEQNEKQSAASSVEIMQSVYYYDQGYIPTEGWRYEFSTASREQIAQLNKLTDALILDVQSEEFRLGQGYHLLWRDASGNVQKEMLILSEDCVSMQGMLFDAEGGAALMDWLDALRLDEQSMGD